MANEKMNIVKTSLIALTKWGKEKKDNKRIDLGYFNDMLYFSILKQNAEGKFKDIQSVYLKGISDTRMYLIAVEMIDRINRIYNGEVVDSQEITIHNNKAIKEATTLVAFNAYKKDDRQIVYITIKKKNKTGEGFEMDERFYFGGAHTIARYGDRKVTDTEVYEFFKQMELIFQAASGRSSDSRSKHLERYLAANPNGNGNYSNNSAPAANNNTSYEKKENKGYHNNNNGNSSKSNEDSDDFPF